MIDMIYIYKGFLVLCILQPSLSKLSIQDLKMELSQRFNMQSRPCRTIYMCHFWRLARVIVCVLLV